MTDINYGAVGEALAMGRAITNARQAASFADDEIAKANAIIEAKNAEIARLRRELAETQAKFCVQIAHTEGLVMQGREMRAALARVAPGHALLKPTGRFYEAGVPQLECHKTFEKHFDRKAAELKLPAPYNKLRPSAK